MGAVGWEGQALRALGTGSGTWQSCEGCCLVSRGRGSGWVPTCDEALAGIPGGQGVDAEG